MVKDILDSLKNDHNLRTLTPLKHQDIFVFKNDKKLINLAGNDYLALAMDKNFTHSFLSQIPQESCYLSSSSSRSLSGNFGIYEKFEAFLCRCVSSKSALIFNSGYHLNVACIASLKNLGNVFFIADKQIHASMVDGLRLSGAKFERFAHNNMEALESLLQKHHTQYDAVIILSEALFSMDGDFVLLEKLIALKKKYPNVLLYLDEAHSVGSFGQEGLGLAKELGFEKEIDFLVFTFGKAIASVGACMLCNEDFKQFFINKARSLIYSTAIPPLNVAFSLFVFEHLESLAYRRQRLIELSSFLRQNLVKKGLKVLGEAYIVSVIYGENEKAIKQAHLLEDEGFFCPAIKAPTVSKNTARLRLSLNANLNEEILKRLVEIL